jgi:hypothetical protein
MGNRRSRVPGLSRGLTLALLFFCSASFVTGLGGGEKKREPQGEKMIQKPAAPDAEVREPGDGESRHVRVSGRVRLVGSDPFPRLLISGEDREWYIDRKEEPKLRDLQQRFVTVEGTESYTDLTFASGLPAGRQYSLKDIKLIEKNP